MPGLRKSYKFWALLGVLAFLLLNAPLLQIFNHDALWGGVPLLVLYLHVVWLLAIAGLLALGRRLTFRD